MSAGEDLINQNHFGSDKVKERLDQVNETWQHLVELMENRYTYSLKLFTCLYRHLVLLQLEMIVLLLENKVREFNK